MIKEFKIEGLHGSQNMLINFEDNIKIIIGENGSGKTTLLNILYYVLTKQYDKLIDIKFKNITIVFEDDKRNKNSYNISKINIIDYYESEKKNKKNLLVLPDIEEATKFEYVSELYGYLNDKSKKAIKNLDSFINSFIDKTFPETKNNRDEFDFLSILKNEDSSSLSRRFLKEKFMEFSRQMMILRLEKRIKELNLSIIYFPTYRRIEENIKNLNISETKYEQPLSENETLIHFGMEDVEKRIKDLIKEIRDKTNTGFNEISANLLSKMLDNFPEENDEQILILDKGIVSLVLNRIGTDLSDYNKNQILDLVTDDNKTKLKEKKDLTYYISQLVELHNKVKHLDDKIYDFFKVCNKYLENKEIKYEANKLDYKIIKNNTSKDEIKLHQLSSGEKQLISIFSRIYLENNENLFVIFDEPELSLSIEWQEKLIPDIVKSQNCKFLLAVTHSPFIFKNDLIKYASPLNIYVFDDDTPPF
ncbi:ATP-binding protein [Aliarcobacter butzleri]|uniref:ATP-binding protein n=1 Tax=Aliarcobacter butzleri TaxID=28197 RepID=UPI0021B55D13|nr:ATP-binding protein [Aliarcobacter butzleri]MCT7565016.1 ATP-binding protein [Aliarcobacter butzleri]